jgi:hypothetical protein
MKRFGYTAMLCQAAFGADTLAGVAGEVCRHGCSRAFVNPSIASHDERQYGLSPR